MLFRSELRKTIENASWSYICPIIRYLIETNNDLQKRIDKALKNIEDLRMEKWSIIGSEIIDE